MKKYNLIIALLSAFAFLFVGVSTSDAHQQHKGYTPGLYPHKAVNVNMVGVAFQKLGYSATLHKDKRGNPHLLITNPVAPAVEVAVFFDDCSQMGCEDLTYYANFGSKVTISAEHLNNWNHIGAKTRSKAFTSDGGEIGLSHTVSFYGMDDFEKVALSAGLFMLEIKLFGQNYLGIK
ncbi:MAG: hypothetical protein HQL68_08610 [Magnetococcales bacterium]|nr:hypothetical protein [Magnetococcales bacterium]